MVWCSLCLSKGEKHYRWFRGQKASVRLCGGCEKDLWRMYSKWEDDYFVDHHLMNKGFPEFAVSEVERRHGGASTSSSSSGSSDIAMSQ